jgi:glutamine synthetase
LIAEKNIKLFEKYEILTELELRSRYIAWCDLYNTNKLIEINVMLEMLENTIFPDVLAYRTFLIDNLEKTKDILSPSLVKNEKKLILEYSELIALLFEKKEEMVANKKVFREKTEVMAINYVYESINPVLNDMKNILDRLEKKTGDNFWSLLKYKELLFF